MKGEMLGKKDSVKIGGETPCLQHFFMNTQEVVPAARSGGCTGLFRSVVRVAFGFFSYFSLSTDHSLHWTLANTLALFLALSTFASLLHLLFPFCVCQPLDFPPFPLLGSFFFLAFHILLSSHPITPSFSLFLRKGGG